MTASEVLTSDGHSVVASCAFRGALQMVEARPLGPWIATPKPARNDGRRWACTGQDFRRLELCYLCWSTA